MTTLRACAVLACIAASPCPAQSCFRDSYGHNRRIFEQQTGLQTIHRGRAVFSVNRTSAWATVEWRYRVPDANGGIGTTSSTLPVHRVGGVERLGGNELLVGGLDLQTGGKLMRITFDWQGLTSPKITVREIVAWPGIDPVQVAYNRSERRIYVRDYGRRRILAFGWQRGTPLPGPGAAVMAGDWKTIAKLTHPAFTSLARADLGDPKPGEVIHNPRVGSTDPPGYEGVKLCYARGRYVRLHETAAGWVSTDGEFDYFYPGSKYWSVDGPYIGGERAFRIETAGALDGTEPFSVIDMETGSTVTTGVLDGPTVMVGPLEVFQQTPGGFYLLRSTDDGLGDLEFRGIVRYGLPGGALDFVVQRGQTTSVRGPYEGDDSFGVYCPLWPGQSDQLSSPISASLWIALRGPDGVDPVTVNGDQAVLTPLTTIDGSFSGRLPEDWGQAIDVTGLGGAVLLFQMVFRDGTNVAYSDVFGFTVRTSLPFTTAAGGSRQGSNGKLDWAAARRVLEARFGALTDRQRARIRELQARIRKQG